MSRARPVRMDARVVHAEGRQGVQAAGRSVSVSPSEKSIPDSVGI